MSRQQLDRVFNPDLRGPVELMFEARVVIALGCVDHHLNILHELVPLQNFYPSVDQVVARDANASTHERAQRACQCMVGSVPPDINKKPNERIDVGRTCIFLHHSKQYKTPPP